MERKDEISNSLQRINERIKAATDLAGREFSDVTLIVVTKTYPLSDNEILLELGVRDFGENRDAEGREKSSALSAIWHFQGQIQSNKIKSISRWANYVHSLDEPRHVPLLSQAVAREKELGIFVQVALDSQPRRGGVLPEEIAPLAELVLTAPRLRLLGIMAVAPLTMEADLAFARLAQIHSDFKGEFPQAPYLSAGMSGDFESAIAHGATHIRIGSSILGSRNGKR
jgi:hypothetical protein